MQLAKKMFFCQVSFFLVEKWNKLLNKTQKEIQFIHKSVFFLLWMKNLKCKYVLLKLYCINIYKRFSVKFQFSFPIYSNHIFIYCHSEWTFEYFAQTVLLFTKWISFVHRSWKSMKSIQVKCSHEINNFHICCRPINISSL